MLCQTVNAFWLRTVLLVEPLHNGELGCRNALSNAAAVKRRDPDSA